MLQINFIRQNRELVLQKLAVRNFEPPELIDTLISLDEQKRKIQTEQEEKLAARNTASKEIGMLMAKGYESRCRTEERMKFRCSKLAIDELEQALNTVEKDILDILVRIPNLPSDMVPAGKTPEDNDSSP